MIIESLLPPGADTVGPSPIIATVCARYDIEPARLSGLDRKARIAFVRHLTMYLLDKHTPLTLMEIGALFRRDHTTVIHARKRIAFAIETEPKVAKLVRELEEENAQKQ